jgi:NaMN:DMB phosphoribosyltransferase
MPVTSAAALGAITGPDDMLAAATLDHLDRLTNPQSALGRLEAIAVRLSAIAGVSPPPIPALVAPETVDTPDQDPFC